MRFAGKSIAVLGGNSGIGLAAAAVLFLASSEASFITGVELYVDGGCVEL
jgi:NAD(P)-dependent dehydrogenase (short-subunit alcohol dehydrogenase family)